MIAVFLQHDICDRYATSITLYTEKYNNYADLHIEKHKNLAKYKEEYLWGVSDKSEKPLHNLALTADCAGAIDWCERMD